MKGNGRTRVIRVLVADDHPLFREGLRRIVGDNDDVEVVGEASTVPELLAGVGRTKPDIVLLDASLTPPRDFVKILRSLRKRGVRILVLGMRVESHYAIQALKGGASGYLGLEEPVEELIRALRYIQRDRTYVSPTLAENLASRMVHEPDGDPSHRRLSEREFQTLLLLGSGKTIGDIARELSLSPKTVSTYRTRLMRKLGLESTAHLVRYALEHELV